MQASKRLVNKSNACARCAEEELVIVSVEVAVEGGQLGWCQVGVVRWFVVLILKIISPEILNLISSSLITYNDILQPPQQRLQLIGAGLVRLKHVAPCFKGLSVLYIALVFVGLRRLRVGHGPCSTGMCFCRVCVHGLLMVVCVVRDSLTTATC